MLTEEQKRMLTEEVLGECWHENESEEDICKHCKKRLDGWWITSPTGGAVFKVKPGGNRTYDNWQDFGALKEALERKGLWAASSLYCRKEWEKNEYKTQIKSGVIEYLSNYDFISWLIDKDRFPKLVAEFMEVNVND